MPIKKFITTYVDDCVVNNLVEIIVRDDSGLGYAEYCVQVKAPIGTHAAEIVASAAKAITQEAGL